MKFIISYGFVTQLVRINDEDLFKDFLYISHLIRLLPKTQYPAFDLTGKVSLEYAKLKEIFKVLLSLKKKVAKLFLVKELSQLKRVIRLTL